VKLTLVEVDGGWSGLYQDGVLKVEGPFITAQDLALLAGIPLEVRETSERFLLDNSGLPLNLSALPDSSCKE
jgi:hypothetical protein